MRYRAVTLVTLCVVGIAVMVAAERSSVTMATAATKLLASLTPGQRARAAFDFEVDDRTRWMFIPADIFPRTGLSLRDMTEPQRELARTLLRSGLSQRGYGLATQIMQNETRLLDLEINHGYPNEGVPDGVVLKRDSLDYVFAVFGTPSPAGTWMWRVEGHHVSLHFTVVNGTLASTPSFFGANPGEVPIGPDKGLRILAVEEDTARALLMSLDKPRRAQAVITDVAPTDILSFNARKADPLSPVGLTFGAMAPDQQDLFMRLIDVYTSEMAPDIAAERMAKLKKAGFEKIAFAWAGPGERGKKHYYRVQGPTFLIEYDNTQNDANHVHSVWRDFNGDFGRDLLAEHLLGTPHP